MKMLALLAALAPFSGLPLTGEVLLIFSLFYIPKVWLGWDQALPWSLGLMSDKLSFILILLSTWLASLMLSLKSFDKKLSVNIVLLLSCLVSFFSVSSLLMFFVLFETSLIPTLFLIMGWGYQPERISAAYYFLFYTITLSLPLMVTLIWVLQEEKSAYTLYDSGPPLSTSSVFTLFALLVFLVKLPIFMGHLWLPKAHVEAPVQGSMILAGVLLKTGGYGILRILPILNKNLVILAFSLISMLGMALICMVCLSSVDLKQLVAYSSVSHMNFMIIGLMNYSQTCSAGSVIMMISHGLCSSLMFMMCDTVYLRSGSRSMILNKSWLMISPSLSFFWSLMILFNMGLPPTPGSLSELIIISVLQSLGAFYWGLIFLYLFLSAFYSAFLYICVNHGNSPFLGEKKPLSVKETLMSVAHLAPLLALVFLNKTMLL